MEYRCFFFSLASFHPSFVFCLACFSLFLILILFLSQSQSEFTTPFLTPISTLTITIIPILILILIPNRSPGLHEQDNPRPHSFLPHLPLIHIVGMAFPQFLVPNLTTHTLGAAALLATATLTRPQDKPYHLQTQGNSSRFPPPFLLQSTPSRIGPRRTYHHSPARTNLPTW